MYPSVFVSTKYMGLDSEHALNQNEHKLPKHAFLTTSTFNGYFSE